MPSATGPIRPRALHGAPVRRFVACGKGGTLDLLDQNLSPARPAEEQLGRSAVRALTGIVRGGAGSVQPLLIAGMVSSAASLLSTVVVARMLTPAGYGALAKLLGLFLVLSLPGTALMVAVVRRTTAWTAAGAAARLAGWIRRAHWVSGAFVAGLLVLAWAVRAPLVHAMHLPRATEMLEVVAAGGLWVLVSMDRGLLQAERQYHALAMNMVVEGVGRTVGMVGLPAAGFGLQGAALGLLLGEVAAMTHVRLALHRAAASVEGEGAPATGEPALVAPGHTGRDLVIDLVVAMVAMSLIAALQNLDVMMFGGPHGVRTGSYAAISVPSKALVFLALLVGNYLLPETSIRFHEGRHALGQFGQLVAVLSVPAVLLMLVAGIVPGRFLGWVFGASYESGAAGFSPLALSMVCLSVTILVTVYLLGTGWRWVVVPLAAGTATLVILCSFQRHSLTGMTHADLTAQAALAAAMAGLLVLRHRRHVRRIAVATDLFAEAPG